MITSDETSPTPEEIKAKIADLEQSSRTLDDLMDAMKGPTVTQTALMSEYRRRLDGKTPAVAQEHAEYGMGEMWREYGPELLISFDNLSGQEKLNALVVGEVLPSGSGYQKLDDYLTGTYKNLTDQGWKFEVALGKSGDISNHVKIEITPYSSNPEEQAARYYPTNNSSTEVPTLLITDSRGNQHQVVLAHNPEELSQFAQQRYENSGQTTRCIGTFRKLSSRLSIISLDFSHAELPESLFTSSSALVHEIDHAVQYLLDSQIGGLELDSVPGIISQVVKEGSSQTAERLFSSLLSHQLHADGADRSHLDRHANNLWFFKESRLPHLKSLFYGAGKLLFNLLPMGQLIQDGKMPLSTTVIHEIRTFLTQHTEVLEQLFAAYFNHKWQLLLAEATESVTIADLAGDEVTEEFRIQIIQDPDINKYFQIKYQSTEQEIRNQFEECGSDDEKKLFLRRTMEEAYKKHKFSQSRSNDTQQHIAHVSEKLHVDVCCYCVCVMFPKDDFVQLAWSEFQNPENKIILSNVLAKACEMPKSGA